MKNQKTIVRILALVMAALLALSLIISVIPITSHADFRTETVIQDHAYNVVESIAEDK